MALSDFKKALTKKGIDTGLSQITEWLSFENLAQNWVCTGSFRRGIPNRRSVLIGGESGATKTMNVLKLARTAQKQGYHVILLDSEASISDQDLMMNDVDIGEDAFTTISVTTHADVISVFTAAIKEFGEDEKLFFIIDSISGLMTEIEDENFDKGKASNDMGRIVQANKKLLKLIGNRIRNKNWFCIATAHVYENQEVTNGRGKYIFSNIGAALYFPSLSIQLTKLDLRDADRKVIGIRVTMTTKKTRFTTLGQKIQLELSYSSKGFSKYDGVLEIILENSKTPLIRQAGAWYNYDKVDPATGEVTVVKFLAKNFEEHAEYLIDAWEKMHDQGYFEVVEKDDEEAILEMLQDE